MKRCPTCNRTFTDPNLSFCIEDGTPLVKVIEPAYDAEATIVSTSPSQNADASQNQDDSTVAWNSPAYQPPPKFPPPPPSKPRKVWPWVVGSLGLLLIVVVGAGIAAAILIPKMMDDTVNRNRNRSSYPANVQTNNNQNSNSNLNENSNSNLNLNQNGNTNDSDGESDSEPPTNEEVVLADLKNIEDEWTVANLNADKKKLARILADDYVSMVSGKMQGKADYLREIQPEPNIQHWEFEDLKLTLNGTRATLSGTVSLESTQQKDPIVMKFTDKFVWRDSRWQATSSAVEQVKASGN
ncbi:MAG TPA: nuclear transport factor 2 family protein [Pyrinomonadaceae bacterium]|nr:nuclear transport factor 2 family protein [Pyrinomonadaceae bacterium]